MKPIILVIGLLNFYNNSYSQVKTKYSYLIINLGYAYDKEVEKGYFIINAELGNPNAKEVYNLRSYKLDRKTINPGGVFFSKKTDADTAIYNYFINATEALEFLSQNNWELIWIHNQITSDYSITGSNNYPYTKVSSYPVYYLRKEIH